MKTSQIKFIKCPHCGYEYHPGELFLPGELIGQPNQILRDQEGKIVYVDYPEYKELTTKTDYICDKCNKPFIVEATVTYKSSEQEEALDFNTQETSLLD